MIYGVYPDFDENADRKDEDDRAEMYLIGCPALELNDV